VPTVALSIFADAVHARARAIVVRLAFVERRLAHEAHVWAAKRLVASARIARRTLGVATTSGRQASANLLTAEADSFGPAFVVAHAAIPALTKRAKAMGRRRAIGVERAVAEEQR
jgi:hypothetical protein